MGELYFISGKFGLSINNSGKFIQGYTIVLNLGLHFSYPGYSVIYSGSGGIGTFDLKSEFVVKVK